MTKHESLLRIIGTGVAVPERILGNRELRLTRNPSVDEEWVAEKLGIRQRHIAEDGVFTSDLAAAAVQSTLRQAGVNSDSIDLLIVATATPDRQAPATACLTQAKAGLSNAVAFDVSAVCSGFLFALTTAASFIEAGRVKRAMVVGADTFSRITDWSRKDCVFFGDGAGAVLVERTTHENSFFDAELFSDGTGSDVFTVMPGERTFTMQAGGVRVAAASAVPRCMKAVMERNHVAPDDIDIVIPHQPSITLLRELAERSGMPFERFRTNMDRYANTAGATIPILLHETVESGDVKPNDLIMFAAAGAGFTAGAALYRWH